MIIGIYANEYVEDIGLSKRLDFIVLEIQEIKRGRILR